MHSQYTHRITDPLPSTSLIQTLGLALLLVTVVSACSSEKPDDNLPKTEPAVDVSIQPLSELAKSVLTSAPGRVVSLNDSTISSELSARVERIIHRPGDNVKKGTTLIELDCSLYRFQKDSAKAMLDIAVSERDVMNIDFKRHQELHQQGLISEEDFLANKNNRNRSQGNVRANRSQLNIAQRNFDNCSISAPFDATVMSVDVSVGELLQPGTPMLRILDITQIEIQSDLTPLYAKGLSVGDLIEFQQLGTRTPIRMISKSAVADLVSGNFKARFSIVDARPDLSGSGRVIWQSPKSFIDASYLRKQGNQFGIMTVLDSRANFIAVEAAREGWPVPIEGIDQNLMVVVKGRDKIKAGDKLNIVSHQPSEQADQSESVEKVVESGS